MWLTRFLLLAFLCMCVFGPIGAYIGFSVDFVTGMGAFGPSHSNRPPQGWDAAWVFIARNPLVKWSMGAAVFNGCFWAFLLSLVLSAPSATIWSGIVWFRRHPGWFSAK